MDFAVILGTSWAILTSSEGIIGLVCIVIMPLLLPRLGMLVVAAVIAGSLHFTSAQQVAADLGLRPPTWEASVVEAAIAYFIGAVIVGLVLDPIRHFARKR